MASPDRELSDIAGIPAADLTQDERHEEIAAAISGAVLAVVEDCGHQSTPERPDKVTAALRGWLQDC